MEGYLFVKEIAYQEDLFSENGKSKGGREIAGVKRDGSALVIGPVSGAAL